MLSLVITLKLTKGFDCGNVVLGELRRLILRCVVDSELFPELLTPDHLSNGGNRGLGALIPLLQCWFLQVCTLINRNGFIPGKPSGRSPLEIDSREPTMNTIVAATMQFNSRYSGRAFQSDGRF